MNFIRTTLQCGLQNIPRKIYGGVIVAVASMAFRSAHAVAKRDHGGRKKEVKTVGAERRHSSSASSSDP